MSQEGTTKDDPLVMPRYSVTKSVLINSLRMWLPTVKQVWLVDDSAGAGRIGTIISAKKGKVWLSCQRSKNLVIKFQELASEAQQVFRDEVNISTRGTSKRLLRRLGALTWVRELQRSVLQRKKFKRKEELLQLSEIDKSNTQPAYIAYTKGYKSKFTFCMRKIDSFED